MGEIKETYLKKYGIWEYILLALGLVFLYSVGKEVVTREWEEFTIPIIGVMVLFLSLGALLIARPFAILEFARKKAGLETRAKKLEK